MNRTLESRIIDEGNLRPPPYYREVDPPQIIASRAARHGPLGMRVLAVLLLSLTALAIAWLAW